MNYLAHFAFNHDICQLEPEPYFVMGVALPDLWPRLSRRRRIRWKCVRAASSSDPRACRLRDGLLNHARTDRRFHALPAFVGWQRDLKTRVATDAVRRALLDFLVHVVLELAMDQHLLRRSPQLADRFYDCLQQCDYPTVEANMAQVAGVNARGLANLLRTFIGRRFMRRYTEPEALFGVVQHVLSLTAVRERPTDGLLREMLQSAAQLVDAATIWNGLAGGLTVGDSARKLPT